jgi:S1-C subfamily serine protease
MILVVGLAIVLGLYAWPIVHNWITGPDASQRPITPRGKLTDLETSTIDLFKKTSPSVAFITTDVQRQLPFNRRIDVPQGAGSGFIWNEQGYVVTNYHVIKDASAAHVILYDQSAFDARVVGMDPDHDLAVLKISPPLGMRLVPIPIGTSEDLLVGQSVFAIGNPFGLDQSLTTGIISALKRTINGVAGNPIEDVIQTDAAINPGNSGGPLLDSAGRLIGINTLIYSSSGTWQGIGFAIPVDTVNRVVPQIIGTGKASRPRLGIGFDESAQQILLRRNVQGLAITYVEPGSPAQGAGLVPMSRGARGNIILGDVITQLNGRPIRTPSDLYSALDKLSPGDTVTLTILRGGQSVPMSIKTD